MSLLSLGLSRFRKVLSSYSLFLTVSISVMVLLCMCSSLIISSFRCSEHTVIPGVGLMVRVVGLVSYDPEFKSHSAVETIAGGVDSARHPSEVGKMSASLLVSCIRVVTRPEDCLGSTNALHRVWSQWMDGMMKYIGSYINTQHDLDCRKAQA